MKLILKRVTRMDQSPMNVQRWCFTLECGHEVWLTRKRRPSKVPARLACERCTETLCTGCGQPIKPGKHKRDEYSHAQGCPKDRSRKKQ